jgi:hypothetical protein
METGFWENFETIMGSHYLPFDLSERVVEDWPQNIVS